MKCEYEKCDRNAVAKGLCWAHYQQQRRGKPLAPIQVMPRKPNPTYCLQCDTQKAREDFYLRPDGRLQGECKECTRKRGIARRAKANEAIRRLEALEGV